MNKVYVVEASFEDFETSWSRKIGIFSNYQIAKEHMKKWKRFFTQNKKVFNQPKDFIPLTYTHWGNEEQEEWTESEEFYKLISKFSDIRNFSSVEISEYELDKDIFIDNSLMKSADLINLMNQWNRDYKLNQITK